MWKEAHVSSIFMGRYFFTSLATLLPFFYITVALFIYMSNRSNSLCPAQLDFLLHTSRLSIDGRTCTSCLVTYSVVTIGLLPFYIIIYKYTYMLWYLCLYTSGTTNLMKGIHLYFVTFFFTWNYCWCCTSRVRLWLLPLYWHFSYIIAAWMYQMSCKRKLLFHTKSLACSCSTLAQGKHFAVYFIGNCPDQVWYLAKIS